MEIGFINYVLSNLWNELKSQIAFFCTDSEFILQFWNLVLAFELLAFSFWLKSFAIYSIYNKHKICFIVRSSPNLEIQVKLGFQCNSKEKKGGIKLKKCKFQCLTLLRIATTHFRQKYIIQSIVIYCICTRMQPMEFEKRKKRKISFDSDEWH